MSKSLGNVLSLDDIRERGFDPMDLRYYLLSVHYRTNLKFSWKGMDDARKARRAIVEWMEEMQNAKCKIKNDECTRGSKPSSTMLRAGSAQSSMAYVEEFRKAMDADLNTPAALAAVFDDMTWSRRSDLSDDERKSLHSFCGMVRATFGCFNAEKEMIPDSVQSLIDARSAARAAKNFAESDRLRGCIEKNGYEVRDTPKGQVVRRR